MPSPKTASSGDTPAELLLDPGFDVDALRAKYAIERDKRLRRETIGHDQYLSIVGNSELADDPWSDPHFTREPVVAETEVVVLGGGFSGMMVAAELSSRQVDDFLIIDSAGDFGGTWYWNRYPGVQCDTESYIYMPFLEETGYIPSQKYADGYEILDHARRVGRHFDLYRRALLQTKFTEARWDEDDDRWVVSTDRNDVIRARFLVVAVGIFNTPHLPRIPGLDSFEGTIFHTSRWDYDYTGGDDRGARMTKLEDKNVGVVGNGCTGLQVASKLAQDAGHLYVFQRTPALVAERNNRPTDAEFTDTLESGWWEKRNRTFLELMEGRTDVDPIQDGWTVLFRNLMAMAGDGLSDLSPEQVGQLAEIADFRYMNGLRERIDRLVDDPEVAERLKGWYGQWCKRPMFNDEYHRSFNRPNVTLVDTDGRGVERIVERGVELPDGKVIELDCLVFASGYDSFGSDLRQRMQMELYGRGGEPLSVHWNDRIKTFQRVMTNGFPNAFFQVLQATVGAQANVNYIGKKLAEHISYIIVETRARGAEVVEVSAEAEAADISFASAPSPLGDYLQSCTPGYLNQEGLGGATAVDYTYPTGQVGYIDDLRTWREGGELAGLQLR